VKNQGKGSPAAKSKRSLAAKAKLEGVELETDSWERFEATVDKAVKPKEPVKPPLSR
jgi:hypothetical protein